MCWVQHQRHTLAGAKLCTQWRTTPLPMDVMPSDMQIALELLPSVRLVSVEHLSAGAYKYESTVTFTSQVPQTSPTSPLLTVNDRLLTPNGAGADLFLSAKKTSVDHGLYNYSICHLDTGRKYFVRVAGINDRGAARPLSPQRLEFSFDQMRASGGLDVDGYRIEAELNSQFTTPSINTRLFHGRMTHQGDALASAQALAAGSASLHDIFSNGERVRIQNEQVTVCLDSNVAWQLYKTDTGLTVAGYTGTIITLSAPLSLALQSVVNLGTQLTVGITAAGPADPAACQAVVTRCSNHLFSYDTITATISLSTSLDNRLVDVIAANTWISNGSTLESAATCRTQLTAVTMTTLTLDHQCVEAATKLGTGNPNIYVHRELALLPLCERQDLWKVLSASSIASLLANLDASGGREPLPVFRIAEMKLMKEVTINCGDYIRLGGAYNDRQDDEALEALATSRIRGKCDTNGCDCVRFATARLQLGRLKDSTVAVSLVPRLDLLHGGFTRDIQRIVLTVTGPSVTYNVGGYRAQFGNEISSCVLGTGGNGGAFLNDDVGCLVWASGPLASDAARDKLPSERELENFAGIDEVRVKRAITETSGARVTVEDSGIHGGTTVYCDHDGFVTIHQAPTTPAISFDASDADVKAALETLRAVSNADVSRQVNKPGYDWRITFVEFAGSEKYIQSSNIITRFQRLELATNLLTSGGGVPIYTRVPGPVRLATTDVLSQLLLHGAISTAEKPCAVVHAVEAASQSVTEDVATITVSAPKAGPNTFLSGIFRVGFDGQWSPELPYDILAANMQAALVALSTIDNVLVARELTAGGYTWLVTFLQRKYGGNQHKRWLSPLAMRAPFGYKLEHLATLVVLRAAVDTTPELQHLLFGFEIGLISGIANAKDLATAVTALGVAGSVNVRFRDPAQTTVCSASATTKGLTIEFVSAQGHMPPFVATSTTAVGVTFRE
ncbi:PROTEIN R07E4.1, ISOFORM A [Plasmopara halstedii]|uniref:PROTEIN R07E4.1, ISOFORM A n=1 Tax=Plasmopara halstedii TaxID=4781 RepID=A0A0P1AWG7_PLAHL|nr:PROTEIN R07E4.1, ISOFORM A [Plasmopara halstedii]CEG45444.1 PROTEIN R07E4.1, ISOFORM A [Plasmopara halstedii]|eukprot:XP_024581813.1 PROTEIN R07E4.1, ISOFORM A [Plasmopara halstedii]